MLEPMIFRFGKHEGKGIEQVAMTDYQYYDWLRRLYNSGKLHVQLSDRFLDRMKEVGYKLENFEAKVKCQCGDAAAYLSIEERFGPGHEGLLRDRRLFLLQEAGMLAAKRQPCKQLQPYTAEIQLHSQFRVVKGVSEKFHQAAA